MTSFTLRDATPADVPTVVRLVRALAEYENLLHEAQGTEAEFHRALFGETPRAGAMIAEVAGIPVALCVWNRTFSTFTARHGIWVEDVFVEPAHRGQGIARAMFRALARRVLDEGGARLEWNVLDWNAPAIAAYRAMGARPLDPWTMQRVDGAALKTLAGD
ncbi:GNAT family N-acetyltransferase [Plastoroseomonas arctica]|uniref:GNAT family N-acetyltransferase n=1 Tax=Plastoroseomonas arctica TaxID=1509237 RepID=A0AAF1K4H6_9PROT|nr:GNAT family N-acetyltransferase [Plastoroseomonas arctica]